jgi:transposase
MSKQQQLKLDIVTKVLAGKMPRSLAIRVLDISYRTLSRYLKAYDEKGILFVLHGNKGRAPHNKIDDETRNTVIHLVKTKYFDFNIVHLWEKLAATENIKVGRETVRRWLTKEGIAPKIRRRRAKIRVRRERMKQPGILLQMDGSYHEWFGPHKSCLIAAIDDCTSDVPFAAFYKAETTLSCMEVLKNIIEKKGLFDVLYVDKAGVYGGGKRQLFSNLERACNELGIQVIFANSPEAKGRIERLFRTLQDRLIPEMRLKGITSRKEANLFLKGYLSTEYAKKFTIPYTGQTSYRTAPRKDLKEVMCIKETRVVNRDHTFLKDRVCYRINGLDFSIAKREVEIRTYLDGSQKVFFLDQELSVEEVQKFSKCA